MVALAVFLELVLYKIKTIDLRHLDVRKNDIGTRIASRTGTGFILRYRAGTECCVQKGSCFITTATKHDTEEGTNHRVVVKNHCVHIDPVFTNLG